MQEKSTTNLVLFSDTFPYGRGETFLAEELSFLARQFSKIIIHPLYIPTKEALDPSKHRPIPDNVTVEEPLLPFDHKDRMALIKHGLFGSMRAKEFWKRAVLGREIYTEPYPRASLRRRVWIFCNYIFMLRSMLHNKRVLQRVLQESLSADKLYFFWGDKSAMLAPYLKKRLATLTNNPPKICVGFNGSDIYEWAKGYLPLREEIFGAIDLAMPVSYHMAEYIRRNYKTKPAVIETYHLGSAHHDSDFANAHLTGIEEEGRCFRIVSCSNLVELKRVGLQLAALRLLSCDEDIKGKIKKRGFSGIDWIHFGEGPLLDSLMGEAAVLNACEESFVTAEFKGYTPNADVLKFYKERGADLFIIVSRSEGVPVSIMEALSYGIPVLATNVGGVSELFRNCPIGILLKRDITALELKEQIVKYICLPEKNHAKMRSNAYTNWRDRWDAQRNYATKAQALRMF